MGKRKKQNLKKGESWGTASRFWKRKAKVVGVLTERRRDRDPLSLRKQIEKLLKKTKILKNWKLMLGSYLAHSCMPHWSVFWNSQPFCNSHGLKPVIQAACCLFAFPLVGKSEHPVVNQRHPCPLMLSLSSSIPHPHPTSPFLYLKLRLSWQF